MQYIIKTIEWCEDMNDSQYGSYIELIENIELSGWNLRNQTSLQNIKVYF